MRKKVFTTLFFLSMFFFESKLLAADKKVDVCTIVWPPYTTVAGKKIEGTHTQKVQKILKSLGFSPTIHEIPWKRCLDKAKQGSMDFVYSVSYDEERAKFLVYPQESLEILSYVVVSLKKNNFPNWKGDFKKIPLPVGVPLGYSVAEKLIEEGIEVDQGAVTDQQNFEKLVKGRLNSIIIEQDVLKVLLLKEKADVFVHTQPFKKNKAYFLAVSKKFPHAAEIAKKMKRALKSKATKESL